jgi:hypothetical protein
VQELPGLQSKLVIVALAAGYLTFDGSVEFERGNLALRPRAPFDGRGER